MDNIIYSYNIMICLFHCKIVNSVNIFATTIEQSYIIYIPNIIIYKCFNSKNTLNGTFLCFNENIFSH